jgi:hypothetical protein
MHRALPVCLVGLSIATGCAPPPAAVTASAPVGKSDDAHDADCAALRERVTTTFVRLEAIKRDGKEDAAKFHAMADVMDKLGRDLDRAYKDREVGALATDFKEAAASGGPSLHDAASMLEKLEAAQSRVGGVAKRFATEVERVVPLCRGNKSADCSQVVQLLSSLGGGTAPTAARVQTASTDLAAISYSTPRLREVVTDVRVPLDELGAGLALVEQTDKERYTKLSAWDRSAAQFKGLSERANQICVAAKR